MLLDFNVKISIFLPRSRVRVRLSPTLARLAPPSLIKQTNAEKKFSLVHKSSQNQPTYLSRLHNHFPELQKKFQARPGEFFISISHNLIKTIILLQNVTEQKKSQQMPRYKFIQTVYQTEGKTLTSTTLYITCSCIAGCQTASVISFISLEFCLILLMT
jgi:hypothetical protein